MVGNKNDMLKNKKPFPLKKVLVAFSILLVFSLGVNEFARGILWDSLAVFTLPNSEHEQESPAIKKETITVTTDQEGLAEYASSSVYITNNKEQDVLIDKSSLTNIVSSASKIVTPKLNKKTGEVKWTLNKKDVSYTGYAEPNEIPVKMDVKYYLDGKRIDGDQLAGKTGKLKIDIKYTSTQTVDVDNRASKVPYVAACVATFDNTAKNIKVKGGSVAKSKQLSIAAGLAFPGWEEVLGKSEVGGLFTNKVVITADVKKMSSTEIISSVSPDLLEGITDADLDAVNVDDAMTLVEAYTKSAIAAAQNVSKALIVADTKVMPMVKSTTAKMRDMSKEIVKNIPEFYKSAREGIGQLEAGTSAFFYFTKQLETILNEDEIPETDVDIQEALNENLKAEIAALYALGDSDDSAAIREQLLDAIEEQYGEKVADLAVKTDTLYSSEPGSEDYNNALAAIKEAHGDMAADLAKLYTLRPDSVEFNTLLNNIENSYGKEISDPIRESITEEPSDYKNVITSLLLDNTEKGGTYGSIMLDQEKLDKISEMLLDPEWLKTAVEEGYISEDMDPETKAIYEEFIKSTLEKYGDKASIADISKATPQEIKEIFDSLNKMFDKEHQDSVTNTAAQISKGIQIVDGMTGKVGVAVHKISNVGKSISLKLTNAYNNAISKVFKMYNKNIRGLTENLKKIKKVDDKAGVFSGMTDEMQGSTSYMFYTPVATKTVNVNKEILDEK